MSDERRTYQNPFKISKALGVKRGMTVADMGCGPGFFTLPLAKLVGPKGSVYAIEANPTMLRHLRDNLRKSHVNPRTIKIVLTDVSKTKMPAACCDFVFLVRILHDIEDKKAFLREVKRICRPGGKVINLDWKKIRMSHGPPYSITLSKPEAMKIMKKNSLDFVRSFEAGRYHYGLIMTPLRT